MSPRGAFAALGAGQMAAVPGVSWSLAWASPILALLLFMMLAALTLAVRHHVAALKARRNAMFLSRLGGEGSIGDSPILGLDASRLSRWPAVQRALKQVPLVTTLSELLEQSGLATTVAMLMAQMLAATVLVVVGLLVGGGDPAGSLLLGLGGAALPIGWVLRARAKRARAFELQLPQALEIISLYLRSGRSLPQAFVGATEELASPAAEEFLACAEEYRLGRPLDVALKRLALKYPESLGFRLFSIAVGVLGQTGGNLVEVLERIKKSLDGAIQYGLRLRAMTGESRMSAWILGALPGVFLLAAGLLNPTYFAAFFDNGLGHVLFGVFLALWMGGLVWIKRLMSTRA